MEIVLKIIGVLLWIGFLTIIFRFFISGKTDKLDKRGKELNMEDIKIAEQEQGRGCNERWQFNCSDGDRKTYIVKREFKNYAPEKKLLCSNHYDELLKVKNTTIRIVNL